METCTAAGEHERLSAWFAAATSSPGESIAAWRLSPHKPRRIPTGITFDIVLAERALGERTYEILRQYEQTLGPAIRFTNLTTVAILVPPGTAARWSGLVANSTWSDHNSLPICIGRDHAIRIPAISPDASGVLVEWLQAPSTESAIGGAPLLTSPAPLVRCLAEARSLLTPDAERGPLSRALSGVRAVIRSTQRM
ncbi:hypothetical protein [Streptomyces angustmyceticus]|uniref:hypothetical protein n=1 Tax=Streptomyces angustmyceticus TaxID=285578 RepID=UPI003D8B587B